MCSSDLLKQPNNALILSLVYLEGLILGGVFILSPILLFLNPKLFLYFMILEFVITSLSLSYGAIKKKEYHLFLYIPHHFVIHIVSESIFFLTFFKEIILNKTNLNWSKSERY